MPVVGACWDADRLDLPRVGTRSDPALLSTRTARDPAVIAACADWRREVPDWHALVGAHGSARPTGADVTHRRRPWRTGA